MLLAGNEPEGGLADVYCSTEDLERGVDHYTRSLALHRELDDRRSIALTLHNLGEIARKQNEPEKAGILYKESLRMSRQIDDRWLTVHMLPGMASTRRGRRAVESARNALPT